MCYAQVICRQFLRHWKCIGYSSLRHTGVYSWDEAISGEYHLILSEKSDVSDDERILFTYFHIMIVYDLIDEICDYIGISCVVTNRFTKEIKSKEFKNSADFINYYNHITKNNEDI